MNSISLSSTSALIVLAFLGGCNDQRKPVVPQTATIPLKVWIVVGVGESGSVGDRSNKGCRLTQGEVQDRIQHLQNNVSFFGSNINFQWSPGTATVIEDNALLPFQPRSRRWLEWHQLVVSNHWQSGRLITGSGKH